jgi:hypothetical protein
VDGATATGLSGQGDSTQIRDLTEFGLMPIVRDLDEFTAQLHH